MCPVATDKHRERVAGRLPDFLIIGAQKCGTSSLYRLLCQHPYVEPAARKEVHFFDTQFDRGMSWYRSHFPSPAMREGRKVLTGESSPYYLYHPHAAVRAGEVVPQAKLIALLRNPVDRAYSHYHKRVKGKPEALRFEDAIEAEAQRLRGEREQMLADESYESLTYQTFSYLSRGIYVDQLMEWRRYFGQGQILVLKSEDFFAEPRETFGAVLEFLGLPAWEPDTYGHRNSGSYQQKMRSVTRRRLEGYFEPHNRRLYDYLGVDFGW
jgi:hypothetical protein